MKHDTVNHDDQNEREDSRDTMFYVTTAQAPLLPELTPDVVLRKCSAARQVTRGGWVNLGVVVEAQETQDYEGQSYVKLKEGSFRGELFSSGGWLAKSNLEGVSAEYGTYTYRVCQSLAIRNIPSVEKKALKQDIMGAVSVLKVGSLVKGDMRVARHGVVYVRLINNGGWLFTCKYGVTTLRPAMIEEGRWHYRVVKHRGKVYEAISSESGVVKELEIGTCFTANARVVAEGTTFIKLEAPILKNSNINSLLKP